MTCEFMKHSIFLKSIDSLNHVREKGREGKERKKEKKIKQESRQLTNTRLGLASQDFQ